MILWYLKGLQWSTFKMRHWLEELPLVPVRTFRWFYAGCWYDVDASKVLMLMLMLWMCCHVSVTSKTIIRWYWPLLIFADIILWSCWCHPWYAVKTYQYDADIFYGGADMMLINSVKVPIWCSPLVEPSLSEPLLLFSLFADSGLLMLMLIIQSLKSIATQTANYSLLVNNVRGWSFIWCFILWSTLVPLAPWSPPLIGLPALWSLQNVFCPLAMVAAVVDFKNWRWAQILRCQ